MNHNHTDDCKCVFRGVPWPMCKICEATGKIGGPNNPDATERAPQWLLFTKRKLFDLFGASRSTDEVHRLKLACNYLDAMELDDLPVPLMKIDLESDRAIRMLWHEGPGKTELVFSGFNKVDMFTEATTEIQAELQACKSMIQAVRVAIRAVYSRKYPVLDIDQAVKGAV